MRRITKAKLMKLKSSDGFWTMKDTAYIGKIYFVDLNTRRKQKWTNLPSGLDFECEIIDARNSDGSWMPLPTEILLIDDKPISEVEIPSPETSRN